MTLVKQAIVGSNRGKSRIWLQDDYLAEIGFAPGSRYSREIQKGTVVLTLDDNGKHTVSRKKKGETETPVIDITNDELTEALKIREAVRIVFRDNVITIRASDLDRRIAEREEAIIQAVQSGQSLKFGSLYHGAGILDSGLHEGFELGGIAAAVKVAVEREQDYLEISRRNNTFWSKDSILLNSPMELLMLNAGESCSLHGLTMGIPCTGASKSGRSKNKLQFAEDHDSAGAQVFYSLDWIKRTNPAVVIIENVAEYSGTASWSIIRGVLGALGYVLQYREFKGSDFGAMENRTRMIAVALSKGLYDLTGFDIDSVLPRKTKPACLRDILDDIDPSSDMYKTYDYLKEKEKADIAAGKGFRLQWLDHGAEQIGTVGRGYNKGRSTEPFVRHPSNPDLARLLTPEEHARAKTIPERQIAGVTSKTIAHEVLGQSVVREWFVCLGVALSGALSQLKLTELALAS